MHLVQMIINLWYCRQGFLTQNCKSFFKTVSPLVFCIHFIILDKISINFTYIFRIWKGLSANMQMIIVCLFSFLWNSKLTTFSFVRKRMQCLCFWKKDLLLFWRPIWIAKVSNEVLYLLYLSFLKRDSCPRGQDQMHFFEAQPFVIFHCKSLFRACL